MLYSGTRPAFGTHGLEVLGVVILEGGQFWLDGRPFLLYSGEIHYFRLSPARWETHLRAARAAG